MSFILKLACFCFSVFLIETIDIQEFLDSSHQVNLMLSIINLIKDIIFVIHVEHLMIWMPEALLCI